MVFFPKQYVINTLINEHYSKKALPYYITMSHLTAKQWLKVKSSIINTNNCLNKVLYSFNSLINSLNKELSLEFYLVDTFLDHFPFISVNQKS